MNWKLLAFAAAASASLFGTASAQTQPVVVELFSSQGCSTCPPTDRLFHELTGRDDIIALALHVDYWDYIGWKDTFAQAKFTQRQKGYAKAAGHRTIYTPQIVVAGQDHIVGYEPMALADLIQRHRGQPPGADLKLTRQGDELSISLTPTPGLEGSMLVQLVRFQPESEVAIERGENAGKVIDYANIVTEWTRLAEWDGKAPLSLTASAAGTAGIAVLLQRVDYGPIVAAAALK
jgi:hypothetical protein